MNIVDKELEIADEMLFDAELMVREKRIRSAVNRSYYAMFHAVKAILLQSGTDCESHGGAMNRFGEYVVKKGLMDKRFAKSLHRAYRLREKSDYHSLIEIEEEKAGQTLSEAREFILEAKNAIQKIKKDNDES